jgi:hypothetical protein
MKPAVEELQRGVLCCWHVLNNRFYIFLKRVLTLTERPALRLLLIVLRPLPVRIRALKPLFRNFLILLLRWFSMIIFPIRDNYSSFEKLLEHYNLI